MPEPLEARPDLLEKKILDRVAELIRYSPELRASLSDLIAALKEQGFEGVVTTESAIRFGTPCSTLAHPNSYVCWKKTQVLIRLIIAGVSEGELLQ